MKITRVGVDIAKSVSHGYAVDAKDHCQWEKKLKRVNGLNALCEQVPQGA